MKNRIKDKLRSQMGASITFALLLFLVCTVLSSVIIVAATASSGRMSQIAETDQRYYAVTSAVELLNKLINGKTVYVVAIEETEYTTTYTAGVPGIPVKGKTETKTYIIPDEFDESTDLNNDNMVGGPDFKIDSILKDAAANYGNQVNKDFSLSSSFWFADELKLEYDTLAVTIKENLAPDGNITLTIYNTNKDKDTVSSEGSRYTMVLKFGADKSETSNTMTENISSNVISDTQYSVVTKTTNTKITTLTWNLTGISPAS